MLYLSRRSVRHSWPLYAGAFIAVAAGVLLLGLAATTTAATIAYQHAHPGGIVVTVTGADQPPHQERYAASDEDVTGLQVVLSMVGSISGFVTIFVVASTFAFVVAARRRELGLLRLVGATPRQVRRMIRGEALTVAVLASLAGSVLAQLATPVLLHAVAGTEFSPVELAPASPWLPLGITTTIGVVVALLGARAAAKRAAKIPAIEALREASVEPRRIGVVRTVTGVVFLGGGITMLVLIRPADQEAAVPLGMFAPMVLVIGLMALAPLVVPPVARLWAIPVSRWTRVSGHLARGTVVASPRRTAALAAPVLGISAVAGSMVLVFGFAADASLGAMRDGYAAPVVVTGHGKDLTRTLRDIPGVTLVDASIPFRALLTDRGSVAPEDGAGIDPDTFARARHLPAPFELDENTVAVGKELSGFEGYELGTTMSLVLPDGAAKTLRVAAIVDVAPEVAPSVMLSKDLVAKHTPEALPDQWFVDGVSAADLDAKLGADDDAVTLDQWIRTSNQDLRDGNRLGLLILLGPAGLYAALAIVNTLLMGSLQRRREYVTTRLLGATSSQVRRTVLMEAGLVALVALSLATVISLGVGLPVRHAMVSPLSDAPTTIQWGLLTAIAAGSLLIAVLAALVPTAVMLRNTRPADAVTD